MVIPHRGLLHDRGDREVKARTITLTPPAGVFAAVQIETLDGRIVGAETCLHPDGTSKATIAATVRTGSDQLRLRWVYENTALGFVEQTLGHGRGSAIA